MLSIETRTSLTIFCGLQIQQIWAAATQMGFPSALWRLPHTDEIKLLISIRNGIKERQPEFEKLSPGFIIAGFDWKAGQDVQFLEGDIILSFATDYRVNAVDNRLGEEHVEVQNLIKIASSFTRHKPGHLADKQLPVPTPEANKDDKVRFQHAVELAVTAIREDQFKKVVLSRTKDLSYSESFQPAKAFCELSKEYPHAFVSLVNLPEQNELWLGASPELLVQQDANGVFKTMSLAGTQKARTQSGELIPKYEIKWGEKEIEEHALVSRYIVECFKKIRLREYLETGPKTLHAGNLYHLRTDFEVDTATVNFPELGSVMLKLLHPTSAVCGVPKEPSLDFLLSIEGYDRSFYSGFLGPAQVGENTSLFVNLRTVRFKNGKATFFAGAGITEDSIPELEWEETELKCDTLLRVIAKAL